jgi:hypothetical protein
MKLSLEGRPKFAEKRDEPPLWAPDYYPEVLEVGFEDMQVYKAPLAFRSPRSPFLDSVRFNARALRVERCNYLGKGLPEISCHVANEAMHRKARPS